MKFIACILIISMGFLGLNRFLVTGEFQSEKVEMSCSMDCCCSQETSCCEDDADNHHKSGEEEEKDLPCAGGCDCSYTIHITAMAGHIQNSINLTARTVEHGAMNDHYFFEYLPPHFQPPRMV